MGVGRPDGVAAADRILDGAYGVAEDAAGNVYLAESNAGLIHKVRPDGIMERFAGTGTLGLGGSGRPALQTNLTHPTILLMDRDGGLLFYEAEDSADPEGVDGRDDCGRCGHGPLRWLDGQRHAVRSTGFRLDGGGRDGGGFAGAEWYSASRRAM